MIVELKGGVKNNSLPCRRFWMGASAPPLFPDARPFLMGFIGALPFLVDFIGA
jgi:hypothetical protein